MNKYPTIPRPRLRRDEEMAAKVRQDTVDAERYRKLRRWMSSNVKEGWEEVEKLGALACYASWDDFDEFLDSLPVCNVGLCFKREGTGNG